jgi:hypothetical protein
MAMKKTPAPADPVALTPAMPANEPAATSVTILVEG